MTNYAVAISKDLPKPTACAFYRLSSIGDEFKLARLHTDVAPEGLKKLDNDNVRLDIRLQELAILSNGSQVYMFISRKPDMHFSIWYFTVSFMA